jgi:iron-sulfur cluster assembly accessory protein
MTNFVLPTKQSVELSKKAIEHFTTIAKDKVVKFGVEGGSCAGHKYSWKILDSTDDLYDDDEVIKYDNFTFVVDGVSLLFVLGCNVDYVSDITGSHLEIFNPNTVASCGCGESVSFG